ncbi:MAG: tetratricopeptide repeat protein [Gammaproteobacteria bacterium]
MNARMAAEAGDVEAAGRAFDRLVEDYPGFAEAWNQRAILRYLVGDITGSLSDIDQALALEPRHFGALSGRGQCYLRMENYRAALNSFEEALGINPWIQSTARQIQMLKAILSQQQPI